jgi:hypothetical protein
MHRGCGGRAQALAWSPRHQARETASDGQPSIIRRAKVDARARVKVDGPKAFLKSTPVSARCRVAFLHQVALS